MTRLPAIILISLIVLPYQASADDDVVLDTLMYPNYGPYEARGTVEPEKQHIPFHYHMWKLIEYPVEGAAKLATLPLAGISDVFPGEYTVGDLTQVFYFDNRKGYICPAFSTEPNRGPQGGIALYYGAQRHDGIGFGFECEYGGPGEHEFGARLDYNSKDPRKTDFSLIARQSRHADNYYYGLGIDSDEDKAAFTIREESVSLNVTIPLFHRLTIWPTVAYHQEQFRRGDMTGPIPYACDNYDGFDPISHVIAGGSASIDSRIHGDRSTSGTLLHASARFALNIGDSDCLSRENHWLYSARAEKRISLNDNRFLVFKATSRGIRLIDKEIEVAEPAAISDDDKHAQQFGRSVGDGAAFWHLPTLGGTEYLRGYPADRFRDNVTAVASIEYHYPIYQNLRGSFFVDFGSAASAWEAFELDEFRTGYGWQLESDLDANLRFRFQFAHSREGFQIHFSTFTRFAIPFRGVWN
jgi:hypothetical protein